MKYLVARTKEVFHIMERRNVGDVEVYEPVANADTAEQAGAIADALNGAERGPRMVSIPDEPNHYVTFDDSGWFIEHSVACRRAGTLGDCDYHRAIQEYVSDGDPSTEDMGRWRIDIGSDADEDEALRLVRA